MNTDTTAALPGILNAWQALEQQKTFRKLMRAFSYPGTIEVIAEAPETDLIQDAALLRTLATVLDATTTIADPDSLLTPDRLSLLESPVVAVSEAQFVLAAADRAPRFAPALGTLESPEKGATLVLRVSRLGEGDVLSLSGPGIDGAAELRISGLDPDWLRARSEWNAGFPLGVDWILVDESRALTLPRTTRIALDAKGVH